jgi:hypothetical protein
MATLQEITDRIKGAVGDDSGLGKSLKFDLKDAGVIHIDGGSVTNEDKPADLTMTLEPGRPAGHRRRHAGPDHGGHDRQAEAVGHGHAMALQPKMGALFAKMR